MKTTTLVVLVLLIAATAMIAGCTQQSGPIYPATDPEPDCTTDRCTR